MWRRIAAIVVWASLAAIAVTSIGSAAWMILSANGREASYKQYAKDSANTDAERSRVNVESGCGPLSAQTRAKCEAEEYYSAHQAQHDDADLEAQRTTAVWTSYLGIAGIIGTAFGLLGVVLVLLTFRENKRAADAAHDANRPWAEGEKPNDISMSLTDEGIKLSAYVTVVNHGNSPALHVLAQGRLAVKNMADDTTPSITLSGIDAALFDWEKQHRARGMIAFPNKPIRLIIQCELPIEKIRAAEGAPPNDCFYLLTIGISYRFGEALCRTFNAYVLMTPEGRTIFGAPYAVPKNTEYRVLDSQIKLADSLEGYAT